MADYRVDPEGVRAIAFALGGLAHSGPPGRLPDVDGCGHPPTVALLDEDASAFSGAWRRAEQAVLDMGTVAVRAADAYAEADASVVAGSSANSRHAAAGGRSATQ